MYAYCTSMKSADVCILVPCVGCSVGAFVDLEDSKEKLIDVLRDDHYIIKF